MIKYYVVHAYRYGNKESHSYPVGVFSTPWIAEQEAGDEEERRGGKYECEIYAFELDEGRKTGKFIIHKRCKD